MKLYLQGQLRKDLSVQELASFFQVPNQKVKAQVPRQDARMWALCMESDVWELHVDIQTHGVVGGDEAGAFPWAATPRIQDPLSPSPAVQPHVQNWL